MAVSGISDNNTNLSQQNIEFDRLTQQPPRRRLNNSLVLSGQYEKIQNDSLEKMERERKQIPPINSLNKRII